MPSSNASFDDNLFDAGKAAENESQFYQFMTVATTRRIPAQNVPRGRSPFVFETTTKITEIWVDDTLSAPAAMLTKNRPAVSTVKSVASAMPPPAVSTLKPFPTAKPSSTAFNLPTPSPATAASPLKPTTAPLMASAPDQRQPFTFPGPSKPPAKTPVNNAQARLAAIQDALINITPIILEVLPAPACPSETGPL
ncbi:hypothetical protein BJ912DRAFT_1054147 [Pholiota molesta]|nr:hypothetical protein BJ912DRAFT_1054147 [Pholiota molesta]